MEIVDVGSEWYEYRLSPGGDTLSLFTDKGEIAFLGIEVMAIQPCSRDMQEADLRKEIITVSLYKPLDHIVDSCEYYGHRINNVTCVAIGPPWLRVVYNCSDREVIKEWKALYIDGDDLAITLICREVQRRDLPADLLDRLAQQA